MKMITASDLVPHRIAQSFAGAVSSYDDSAELQRWAGRMMLRAVSPSTPSPNMLDVGTGTGFCASSLVMQYPNASVTALDLVFEMLKCAEQRPSGFCVQGTADQLPLKSAVYDVVLSNLCIQWCPSPAAALMEWFRVLRPGGAVLFSTLGPKTLGELRAAWACVDPYAHVIDFHDVAAYIRWLEGAGFEGVTFERHIVERPYPNVLALLNELKGLGARNASRRQSPGLTGRKQLSAMMQRYEERHGSSLGVIPATFDVFFFFARSPGMP